MSQHLCPTKGTHAMFVENFKNVYKDAKASSFKKLKLFSEKKESLFWVPDISGKNSYDPEDFLHYRKRFDECFCGFLLCSIDDLAVFNDWTLGKAVETRAKDLGIDNAKEISELIKVCKVLLSEAFAKKLLTNALVEEFYGDYENSDSFFDVRLAPKGVNDETHILRLEAEYTHQRYSEGNEHVFKARFRFSYDFAQHDFGAEEVCLKLLQFDDFEINPEPDEKVMRLRENPLEGRLNRDVYGMKARKKAFENFSGKRPRSPDSEDEAPEKNFKRKKEERSALGTNREM
jgi:hypothetical protein